METTTKILQRKAGEESDLPSQEAAIDSVTLARLIDEVRNEETDVRRSYDRTHNRHNR